MTILLPGQVWRTERQEPSKVGEGLHLAGWATIHGLVSVRGKTWVNYGYRDSTDFGYFEGRDSDLEADFRRRFPVCVDAKEAT